MFDLSWGEMAIVGVIALVVLGPKELPNALRTMTNLTRTARKLAGEFQSGVNEIVREAELEDARKVAQSIGTGSISKAIEKVVDPTGEMKSAVKAVESDVNKVKSEAQVSPVGPVAPPSSIAAPAIAAPLAETTETTTTDTAATKVEADAKV